MAARLCPNPSCRKESRADDEFCRFCGTKLVISVPPQDDPPRPIISDTPVYPPGPIGPTPDPTLAKNELWSWLKRDARRQLFFTDSQDATTETQYMNLVSEKLRKNDVPATIEKREIRWDLSSYSESMWFVKPQTDAVDPLACFLEFSHVGKYTFSEQKTFLVPPNLPEAPGEERELPEDGGPFMLPAIILMAAGAALLNSINQIVGLLLFAAGAGLMVYDRQKHAAYKEALDYNMGVRRKLKKWIKAWNDWEDTVLIHAFQEDTHGKVSRIYEAVFDTIKQVNAELFKNVEKVESRDDQSMNEIMEQIARRKEEAR